MSLAQPNIDPGIADKAWKLLGDLYAIADRTLMGQGYERSLDAIASDLPLHYWRIPTGTKLGSWVVPPEWEVREAWIRHSSGDLICDFRKNPMHLWHYSIPFSGSLSLGDLKEHLSSHPQCPHGIPHVVTYYKERWGFSLPHSLAENLTEGSYEVCVDSGFKHGNLVIGEIFLPGQQAETILIDAVLSSPSLANNTSGPALATALAWQLQRCDRRRYSYRILYTPETIGPVACHHALHQLIDGVIGGCTLSNLGDSHRFSYRASRSGNTLPDRAMRHVLKGMQPQACVEAFDVRTGTAGNEKAWNSLGIETPIGALRRSPFGSYPEYDTSADDMGFVDQASFAESLNVLWRWITAMELNATPRHTYIGEPFLTGYGLFPKIVDERERLAYDYLMAFCDGREDLLSIADRAELPIWMLMQAYSDMRRVGLLEEDKTP